jgi:hypothetical protein
VRENAKRRTGSALVITVLVLTVVSLLAIAGIRNAERESTTSARSRNTTRTLAAADSGIQLVLNRIAQSPPNLTGVDVELADGASVQSRTRDEVGPQALNQIGLGTPKEGYGIGVGSGVGFITRIFLVNTTATAGGSTVELQAKATRSEVEASGY